MPARARLLPILIVVALVVSVGASLYALNRPESRPDIQGVLLQQPQSMPDFSLTDHRQQPFTREDLQGQWHLITYGFTHCPDICPMALSVVSRLAKQVEAESTQYNDLGLLFYSVDPKRDTPDHLSDYVPFFHPEMIGLTLDGRAGERHEPFEKGLGIVYEIPQYDRFGKPWPEDEYPVNHGVKIYLLNPAGRLQAVFEPEYNEQGMLTLSTDRLLADYLAVRRYLDRTL